MQPVNTMNSRLLADLFTKHAPVELTLAVQYSVIYIVVSRAEVIDGLKRQHLLFYRTLLNNSNHNS